MIDELDSLKRLSQEGLARIKSIRTATKVFSTAVKPPRGEPASPLVDKATTYAKGITAELDKQEELLKSVKALTDAIAKEQVGTAKGAKPLDIARNLRGVVDTLQGELGSPQSGFGTALRNFDVELKGVVMVQDDETRIVLPPPTERLEAHQVSTFKMSFAAVPVTPPES